MSYEDVIRVAQAKIDPARLRASRRESARSRASRSGHRVPQARHRGVLLGAAAALARRILAVRRTARRLARVHWAMEVNTTIGLGLSALLAARRSCGAWRPRTYRYRGAARDRELAGADRRGGAPVADLALEVAECARLIKGYGDTHKRGIGNYRLIETR